jgi:hypothetical protein
LIRLGKKKPPALRSGGFAICLTRIADTKVLPVFGAPFANFDGQSLIFFFLA